MSPSVRRESGDPALLLGDEPRASPQPRRCPASQQRRRLPGLPNCGWLQEALPARSPSGALDLPLPSSLPPASSRLSARQGTRRGLPEGGCQTCSRASTVGAVLRVGGQRPPCWRRGEVSQASRAPARPAWPKSGRLGWALLLPPPPPNLARKQNSGTCPPVSPDWRLPANLAVQPLRPRPLWPREDGPGPRGEGPPPAPAGRSPRVSGAVGSASAGEGGGGLLGGAGWDAARAARRAFPS